jgi:3-deoxy-D-manno-octulosonic-acid transferase
MVYPLLITLYLLGLVLAAPFNSKARKMIQGRWQWRKRMRRALPKKTGKRIWFHCASLGEFEMIRPLLDALKKEQPETSVVISFFSPSGYEQRKSYPCDGVFYLPLDFERNAKLWYRYVQPDMVIFVKYEFWLRYMQQGLKYGCKMVAVGCLFREEQFVFEPWAKAWKRCLQDFDRVFVQNETSAEKARAEGLRNISISGDTRFDRVLDVIRETAAMPEIALFKGDNILCVAGSCWPPEEKLLQEFFINNGMPVNRKFILVPHDIGKKHIADIQKRFSEYPCITYSEWQNGADISKAKILIVDCIGVLNGIYAYADIAIIGGAFGKGLHNMLEAASRGIPILFGPKHQKFPEALESIEAGFGYECEDYNIFEKHLKSGLGNPEFREYAGKKAQQYITSKAGATAHVMGYLNGVLLKNN